MVKKRQITGPWNFRLRVRRVSLTAPGPVLGISLQGTALLHPMQAHVACNLIRILLHGAPGTDRHLQQTLDNCQPTLSCCLCRPPDRQYLEGPLEETTLEPHRYSESVHPGGPNPISRHLREGGN